MADPEMNAAGAMRYYRALVSAYNSIHKCNPAPNSAAISNLFGNKPSKKQDAATLFPSDDRQALIRELKGRIDSLGAQLRDTTPIGETERRKLRKLEAKIDIFRAKLEGMQV